MKVVIQLVSFLFLATSLYAQPVGFNIDNMVHVSFRYDDGIAPFFQESSHYQPGILEFFADNTYQTGSAMTTSEFRLRDPDQSMELNLSSLVLKMTGGAPFEERVRLDYDGLNFVNGASWGALDARILGNGGQLDLYTGVNGNALAMLGSTSSNSLQGNLRLYGPNGGFRIYDAVASTNYGYSWYYGEDGSVNLYFGISADRSDGRIIMYDDNSAAQGGMYIDGANQGIIWGDIKSFRMKHPDKSNTEIWYASIEGPEAAAYERGTTKLVNGEAFIEFSEHYRIVANHTSMTVNLTPLEWDTYGLAVVEKTANGFRVKELKGGAGNFSFDWEVKCVRKGKEKFRVIRSADDMNNPVAEAGDEKPGRFSEKVKTKVNALPYLQHNHVEGCVHYKQTKK